MGCCALIAGAQTTNKNTTAVRGRGMGWATSWHPPSIAESFLGSRRVAASLPRRSRLAPVRLQARKGPSCHFDRRALSFRDLEVEKTSLCRIQPPLLEQSLFNCDAPGRSGGSLEPLDSCLGGGIGTIPRLAMGA